MADQDAYDPRKSLHIPAEETQARHPSTEHILQFFSSAHLPDDLHAVSQEFTKLADRLCSLLKDGPELTVALRKLLESKDAAVRHALTQRTEAQAPDA